MSKEEFIASIAIIIIIAVSMWIFFKICCFIQRRREARLEKEKKEKKARTSEKPPPSDDIIKWVGEDVMMKAIQNKKVEKKQEADNRKKLENILKGGTLLSRIVKKIWKNKESLGGVHTSLLEDQKTFFGVHDFVIENKNKKKKITFSINSVCENHAVIGNVLISAKPVADMTQLKNLVELTPEKIEEIETLLIEIY
ncbi:MAG: hypothetical protein KAS07_01085, partial [Candidatus Pacebacteria bacterium]|nr:hypothetical protein [Candidatus Paceibacterota bacterium]